MASGSEWEWEGEVREMTRRCRERRESSLAWACQLRTLLQPVPLPSVDLSQLLVSLCLSDGAEGAGGPALWKYLEHAMASFLVYPFLVLALLTSRVIFRRQLHLEVYRLYLELVNRYAFSFDLRSMTSHSKRILEMVDEALEMSHCYEIPLTELGQGFALCIFTMFSDLVNATAEDCSLEAQWTENQAGSMEGLVEHNTDTIQKHHEKLKKDNAFIAIQTILKLTEQKRTFAAIRLVCMNMFKQRHLLCERLKLLEVNLASSNTLYGSKLAMPLNRCVQKLFSIQAEPCHFYGVNALINGLSSTSAFGRSSQWLPFDLFMENKMDGRRLPAISAISHLVGLAKSLKAAYCASWYDVFLGLWTSALRLVQREPDPCEGPIPHLESRLCILLSIVPLVVGSIIHDGERESLVIEKGQNERLMQSNIHNVEHKTLESEPMQSALQSSLKILGQFTNLLVPPQLVAATANDAAMKAKKFIYSSKSGSEPYDSIGRNFSSSNIGNLWHLIVEACIARKLVNSSAYLWPSYVRRDVRDLGNPLSEQVPLERSPWSFFMEGASLSIPLRDSLMVIPAPSLTELEKMYDIALNGAEEESRAAASILCGASLLRGWNIQEHTVELVVKLLSPSVPSDICRTESHLLSFAPLLQSVLKGLTSIDALHVLALYGKVPEVAAALMPICEVFGSINPKDSAASIYIIFSKAFLLLFRLWKLYACAHEHILSGRGAPVGSELTLEYLLLIYNSRNASSENMGTSTILQESRHFQPNNLSDTGSDSLHSSILLDHKTKSASVSQNVFLDSFPNLKHWYCQHHASFASNHSSVKNDNPIQQTTNNLLNMMYRKLGKRSPVTGDSSSNSSLSEASGKLEDSSYKPVLTAWEILQAVPLVVEAVLTACAQGKLLPRDLITGLRDLVDFLPASVATIVSYFTAEITRGAWNHVIMNGTDWPSPAANLAAVEAEIKEILDAVGINVPSPIRGVVPITLPLPLAALVSLTITSKLDKSSELFNGVSGSALEASASITPWPSTAIVAALWLQKVRRWHTLILFCAARTVFLQNKSAVAQLIRRCFTAVLGSNNNSKLTNYGGVGPLLGHAHYVHASPDEKIPLGPGFLYLRIFRAVYDLTFIVDEILSQVINAARDLAVGSEIPSNLVRGLKSCNLSLVTALERVKQASSLGASLLYISGGPKLVQLLYEETLPTWFLTASKNNSNKAVSGTSLEGYAIAHLSFLSCSIACEVEGSSFKEKRASFVGSHMEFIAKAMKGELCLGCDHATWRAYVLGIISMVITCASNWLIDVNLDTLKMLAVQLKIWNEPTIAFSLLEKAGLRAMSAAIEFIT